MKLMKSCFLRHLFTLLLLLCTVVTTSKAETDLYDGEKFCVDGLGYRVMNAKERIVASSTVLNMEKPSGSIRIPDYVTYKGYELTVIEIDNGTFSGCTELESVVIGNNVKRIGQDAFRNCTNLASATIGNSVTTIGAGAFDECDSLTDFVIPGNVEIIEGNAFYCCDNLKNIIISYGVKTIGTQAFSGCNSLDNVIIPSSVTIIEHKAFYRCSSLTSIDIPGSVETIVATAFCDCPLLKTVTIREGVKSIGGEAFAYCVSLTEIEIPNSVTSIGNTAFAWCSALESVTIGDGTETIGDSAFNGCTSLTDLTIGDNVKSIGNSAFSGCTRLRSIELPNSVTEIKESAFRSCKSLTSITIPENVASIGEHTFSDCSGLTSITSLIPKEDLFAINSNAFNSINKNSCILYVPYGAKETYASTAGWKEFTNIVEMASYIHYKVDGEVLFSEKVAWGAEITPAAGIEKPGYRFIGWDGLPQYMPRNDIEVNGVYEENVVSIVINQYGNATYCSPYALDFSNVEGLKAYAATGYNKQTQVVTLTRVLTAQEGTGLFLTGEPGEYTIPVIENSNDYTLNLLVGTLEPTIVNSTAGAMSNYKFTIAEGDAAPMFYPFEDNTTFSAGKAYLQIPTAWLPVTAQKSLNIRFDDGETTDIDEMKELRAESKGVYYDLCGRVVENPTSGIYVINGKKVVVK